MDAGFLDYGHEGLLGGAARFEEAGEAAALAQLRDLQRDPPSPRVPVAVAVSVALNLPHRRASTLCRARPCLNLSLHDPLGGEGQHLAHKVAISTLFNQLKQRHSVVGHRHLRFRFHVLQPEPFPKIGGDRQRHPRPRAALRRRLRARPPTPPPGTLPARVGNLLEQARNRHRAKRAVFAVLREIWITLKDPPPLSAVL